MNNNFSWLNQPNIKTLINILSSNKNHNFKFVGGCVRDSLLGLAPIDFDLASNLKPEENIKIFTNYGIKTITNASKYGTITAIINKQAFEITSLRKDIETFGRHALVSYTEDFLEDAKRRDFTFNALYLCPFTKKITDYFNGINDLQIGKVRFIGDINQRIQEDYLRILRFVRFYTLFGKKKPTVIEIKTIHNSVTQLKNLSKERIISELNKIINSSNIIKGLQLINQLDITSTIFNVTQLNLENLTNYLKLENKLIINNSFNNILKLVIALNNFDFNSLNNLYNQKSIKAYLKQLGSLNSLFINEVKPKPSEIITMFSYEVIEGYALINLSKKIDTKYFINLLKIAKKYQNFILPINGDDLLKLGIKSGKQIGKIIQSLAIISIEKNITQKNELLKYIKNNYKIENT
ncbi:CCA tRNA nucleotidyltransferase [Rickettsiales bacterium LUAb2]